MRPARRCRLTAVLGFATLVAAAPPPAVAQADDVPSRDDAVEDAVRKIEAADTIPVEQVVRFSVVGNDLAVASDLKAGDGADDGGGGGPRLIKLRGLPGSTLVEVGARFRGPLGLVPFFDLSHTGAAGPEGGAAQTSIKAQGNSVTLERTTRVGDTHTNVSYRQGVTFSRRGRIEQRGERVRLRVRISQLAMPGLPVEESWEAASFTELLRSHPGPAARHLAPLFQEFGGQDAAVFRVDPRVAWQLFPDAVDANEHTAAKVLALVDRLDSDDFRERELATAELEVLGGPAMLALDEVDRGPLSPEQNTRIDAILARYTQLDEVEVASLLDDPEFLLRCFAYSDIQPVRVAAAKALARKLGDEHLGLDPSAKLPDRVRAADKVRERLPDE